MQLSDELTTQDPSLSNSLTDLAARIKTEHGAAAASLGDAVRHAITAGELLIEAKALVRHGQWLQWLRDHCSLSERTCQLYMRLAKSRVEIEKANAQSIADSDLTLNEAAALLMLSSDVRKLLAFTKTAEGLSGEGLVDFCIANDVGVIRDKSYDPFAGGSEAEKIEWMLFTLFLSCDLDAGRSGFEPQDAWSHVEYLLQRPFQNVGEWLGLEGDKWRRLYYGEGRNPTETFKTGWAAFRDRHQGLSVDDVTAEAEALEARFLRDQAAGRFKPRRHARLSAPRSTPKWDTLVPRRIATIAEIGEIVTNPSAKEM